VHLVRLLEDSCRLEAHLFCPLATLFGRSRVSDTDIQFVQTPTQQSRARLWMSGDDTLEVLLPYQLRRTSFKHFSVPEGLTQKLPYHRV
jgi:hypothetical protein